jgi:hypothetical protein
MYAFFSYHRVSTMSEDSACLLAAIIFVIAFFYGLGYMVIGQDQRSCVMDAMNASNYTAQEIKALCDD